MPVAAQVAQPGGRSARACRWVGPQVDDEHRGEPLELWAVGSDASAEGLEGLTKGGGADLVAHKPAGSVSRMGDESAKPSSSL